MTGTFQSDYDLQAHNSLAVPSRCAWFLRITDSSQLSTAVTFARDNQLPLFVLGSGTNVVLGEFLDAVVVQIAISGRTRVTRDSQSIVVEAGAGEDWHQFVIWCLELQIYGLENLALIPGTCGAAPIQNIGAYGIELSEFLESVEVFDLATQQISRMTAAECELAYRDSIFKRDLMNRAVILSIRLRLQGDFEPNLEYPALANYLASKGLEKSPQNIFDAVCSIRSSKLPDPEKIPNSGSFFKNPVLAEKDVSELATQYPDMPFYQIGEGLVKIPAAWLIDQAGWKGWLRKGVGVHGDQALVLVNPGKKPAAEILELAEKISASVRSKFGVELQLEPRVIE